MDGHRCQAVSQAGQHCRVCRVAHTNGGQQLEALPGTPSARRARTAVAVRSDAWDEVSGAADAAARLLIRVRGPSADVARFTRATSSSRGPRTEDRQLRRSQRGIPGGPPRSGTRELLLPPPTGHAGGGQRREPTGRSGGRRNSGGGDAVRRFRPRDQGRRAGSSPAHCLGPGWSGCGDWGRRGGCVGDQGRRAKSYPAHCPRPGSGPCGRWMRCVGVDDDQGRRAGSSPPTARTP